MMTMSTQIENTATTATLPILDELRSGPPTVSVPRAGEYLGVSRACAYKGAREGWLPTIKIGDRRRVVPTAALLRMLEGGN